MKYPEKDKAVTSPKGSYRKKYHLKSSITNQYCASVSNPTVQPDARTPHSGSFDIDADMIAGGVMAGKPDGVFSTPAS